MQNRFVQMFLKHQHSNTYCCDWNKLLNTTESTYLNIYVVIKSHVNLGLKRSKYSISLFFSYGTTMPSTDKTSCYGFLLFTSESFTTDNVFMTKQIFEIMFNKMFKHILCFPLLKMKSYNMVVQPLFKKQKNKQKEK